MSVRRNTDGTISVPARIEQDGIIGEGEARIGPDNPDYQMWDDWLGESPAETGDEYDDTGTAGLQ